MVSPDAIAKYYISQAQFGGNIGEFYSGRKFQRGYGFSSFFSGLFKRMKPLLLRGAKAVGKEALRSGANILADVATTDAPVKEIVRTRLHEGKDNLINKAKRTVHEMTGSGIRGAKRRKPTHSPRNTKRRRTTRCKASAAQDIFS